jgi:mediator of RNA polymerase II transcription subunit 22
MNKGGAGGVGGGGSGLGSGGGGGGSGPTAAAAASAAQKQKMLLQRVETDISNIVDNFSHLVNVSRVIFPFFLFF